MAEAGFYYYGIKDQVLCYHCNGGLNDWEPEDDPSEEHAKWFPKCDFLDLVKGSSFVEKIQRDHFGTENQDPSGFSRSVPNVQYASHTSGFPLIRQLMEDHIHGLTHSGSHLPSRDSTLPPSSLHPGFLASIHGLTPPLGGSLLHLVYQFSQ